MLDDTITAIATPLGEGGLAVIRLEFESEPVDGPVVDYGTGRLNAQQLCHRLLAAAQQITHQARAYRRGDLQGTFLAYAATDSDVLHTQITDEAHVAGVLLNVVDQPALCDFIMPAIVARGDLVIATSTGGASPALAKRIRHDLEDTFGPEYDLALQLLVAAGRGFAFTALGLGGRHHSLQGSVCGGRVPSACNP
jgi:siroheme synthase (precorrin-2 oxidase/ferrochelatase)